MTIKERVGHEIMDQFLFQNPLKKSLEECKIKYKSKESSYEELIPALDQRWCKENYIFTLYMPPPVKGVDGNFPLGSKQDWLERIKLFVDDLNLLLQLEYHRFWSEVVFNENSLAGVSSFLQFAPPFYQRDRIQQDKEILNAFKKAHDCVFLLLVRLTTSAESENAWMKMDTLGNILYNKFVISLPQLMDISLIYAKDNFKEVTELVNRVVDSQPKYMNDIEKSVPFFCEVFNKFKNHLSTETEVNGELSRITDCRETLPSAVIVKLISLMLDIGYSLATFIEVCPRAGTVFHEHLLEPRIATFCGNTVSALSRHLDSQSNNENTAEEYEKCKFQLNLGRHQLISAAHSCLTAYFSSILEERDCLSEQELKNKVDNYLDTLLECLSADHVFVRDYDALFPVQKELKVLAEICPDIDSLKCNYIEESVLSLYDLPPRLENVKSTQRPPEAASSSAVITSHTSQHPEQHSSKKIAGVELESLITEVKDILPHLGDGFIGKCLENFNFVSADVINAILESTLPESLTCLDPEMPIIPPEENEIRNGLPERINVFDNDEFDIMTRDKIDATRIHKGKRQEKHKDLCDLLDDKSHVNQLRDVYTQLSLVECVETINDYEDEYDDTYDDLEGPAGNEGETEERRAFVVPRVLQQRKKSHDEQLENDEEEDEDANEGAKSDLFIENPADIRERAEQRRQEMRGRGSGRSRSAFQRRDVVGKPKGQGQDKEVVVSREFKNTNKASRANHNRRAMADKKRRQGMFPS